MALPILGGLALLGLLRLYDPTKVARPDPCGSDCLLARLYSNAKCSSGAAARGCAALVSLVELPCTLYLTTVTSRCAI